MKTVGRSMALNSELVARVHRIVPDTGPTPGFVHMQDEDYDRVTESMLREHPTHEDLWLFAYGSLMWRPACEIDGQEMATLRGWHRKFCISIFAVARHTGSARPHDGAGSRRVMPGCCSAIARDDRARAAWATRAPRDELQGHSD